MPSKLIKNGELLIYGTIGEGFFSDDTGFVNALDVAEALAEVGRKKDITVRLNSGGGDAFEGMAIYSQFKTHKGKVTMLVDSIAASAASVIAMAGDQIVMRKGSMMMIHDPSGLTVGDIDDHEKTINALTTLAESMADVYAERTGLSDRDTRKAMREETWLTAEEAMELGYADRIDGAQSRKAAKWDYRSYQHAPERMVALAAANGWTMKARASKVSSGTAKREERQMTDKDQGGQVDAPDVNALVTAEVEKQLKLRAEAEAKAVADAAKETKPESPEAMAERIRKEEQKRTADITAACNLAGQGSKAAAFIAEGKSLSEVVASLQQARASGKKDTTEKEINNHRSDTNAESEVDPKKAWARITGKLNKKVAGQRQALNA